ncbi:MAG: tRNA (guanosine(37)-N1)-methyltransferase TrmD [Desulfobacterales bacterium]|nr:tRNA (guanosine(37)-N1)-methyltransferase TrmD [Desulfobacterales bacterium]
MKFSALTIFPEMFDLFWSHGIVRRAIEGNHISASSINIRDFAEGRHKITDDRPFGGGCGMVMKPEPLASAIKAAGNDCPGAKTILMSPQGRAFNQDTAWELAKEEGLILVCGRYEGVDERICDTYIDDEISIGDYVLTGGELAAMIIIDAVTRLIPGVLGGEESAEKDSFSESLLEHGHYTRPREFEGMKVPEVLLSGDHARIEKWRQEESLIRTFLKRKDLLESRPLSKQEKKILESWCHDIERIIKS